MKKMFLLVFVAIVISSRLFAQFDISGRVVADSGEVLPAAHVTLSNTLIGVACDRKGDYKLTNLKEGAYTLVVSFIGYQTWERKIYLKADTVVNIILSRSNILADEVIVSATRANENDPVAYTNIDREQLSGMNGIQDIPYLLELTPSLVTTSDAGTGIGYSGLRIRGTDPSRINVTLNGIPYNDSESHDVYWVNIPDFVSSVDNIQIQRGIGTSTQGAAAFGANINFQTKSVSSLPYAEIQSSLGSFNTYKNVVSAGTGLIHEHLSVDLRLSQLSSDGYIDRAFAKMKSYYLSAGWYGKNNIIKLTSFAGKELTYQAWGGVPGELLESDRTFNPYTYDNEVDDYTQTHYQLHWSSQPLKNLNFNLALHYTKGKGFYEQFREDDDFSTYLLDPIIFGSDSIYSSDLVRRKWLDNNFYGGIFSLNYSLGSINITGGGGWNQYDGDHFGRVIWNEYEVNSEIDHQYYFSNGLKTDWNYFTKVNYQVLPSVNLYADLQYRHIDYSIAGLDDDQRDITQNHVYNFLNPKSGLSVDISQNQQIYFSFSVGNREPKRSNFTDAAPSQEIKPERLNDFEFGHRFKSSHFSIATNMYFMDYKDQLVLTGDINDVGSPIMENVEDSYRAGLEFVIALQAFKNFRWDANATLSRNRIKSFLEYVDDWDNGGQREFVHENSSLAFSPEFIAGSQLTWNPLSGLKFSLQSKYVGKQYIDNTSSDDRVLNPYLVNNLRMSYSFEFRFLKEINVFFDVINVLDEKYESNAWIYSYFYEGMRYKMDGFYPQAGRHFMFGVSLKL